MNRCISTHLRPGRAASIHCLVAVLGIGLALRAATAAQMPEQNTAEPTATDDLAFQQGQLADKYERLEKLILRMAEFDAQANPRRADLLKQAFALSKERHVRLQLESLVELLNGQQLGRAVENQNELRKDLQALLELLLTENRSDRLRDEQARVRSYIKEIERLERMQRSVQGRTEGGVPVDQVGEEQQRVAQRTAELNQRIGENEGQPQEGEPNSGSAAKEENGSAESGEKPAAKPGDDSEPGDAQDTPVDRAQPSSPSEPSDKNEGQSTQDLEEQERAPGDQSQQGQSQQGQSQQGESQQEESQQGQGQQSEGQQGQGQQGQPPQGQPPQGQPPQGQGDHGAPPPAQPPAEQFPGQRRIQEAEAKMRDAELKLEQARRDDAVQDQDEAARKLAEAKAELEEILRQLREEEIERMLTMLEARFRKMLQMELQVYENTIRLDKIPLSKRDRFVDIEAGKLSFQQRRIVGEADKCLNLLREEGSSVAFPESVEQMREDMDQVGARLARAKVGRITQGLEEDIIEALDEMVTALEKAQLDQEQRRNQGAPPPGNMDPQDQPLVDQIAELKMLKALQLRVNKRTTRYARLLSNRDDPAGQATDDELILALGRLSDRESRLYEITRELVLGRNK